MASINPNRLSRGGDHRVVTVNVWCPFSFLFLCWIIFFSLSSLLLSLVVKNRTSIQTRLDRSLNNDGSPQDSALLLVSYVRRCLHERTSWNDPMCNVSNYRSHSCLDPFCAPVISHSRSSWRESDQEWRESCSAENRRIHGDIQSEQCSRFVLEWKWRSTGKGSRTEEEVWKQSDPTGQTRQKTSVFRWFRKWTIKWKWTQWTRREDKGRRLYELKKFPQQLKFSPRSPKHPHKTKSPKNCKKSTNGLFSWFKWRTWAGRPRNRKSCWRNSLLNRKRSPTISNDWQLNKQRRNTIVKQRRSAELLSP